jgi:hypothetical protein
VKELVEVLEHLPLAIVQAAAFIDYRSQTVAEYLELYRSTESAPIWLLDEEFFDPGRYEQGANAVFRTLAASFDQIRRIDERAAGLLSMISFFDHKNVPEILFCHLVDTTQALYKSTGLLKAFSLVTASHDSKALDLHRLCRVCVQGWLQHHNEDVVWADRAMSVMAEAFPNCDPKNWPVCAALLPHAQAVLHTKVSSRQVTNMATLQVKVAWYLDARGQY